MASQVITKKANLLGQWHEDVFTDELVKKIAAYAAVEKGKKVKVKLSESGLRITEPRGFLRQDESHFYAMSSVKTVTRNPLALRCVMFILADPRRRYQVIAVRCELESDAAQMVSYTAQQKKDQQAPNVSFRKRANGNWTLRDRSAHNANRHMAELFSQQSIENDTSPPNGNALKQTPAPDTPRSNTGNHVIRQGSYIKRNGERLTTTVVKIDQDKKEDDSYVIETEVANETQLVNVNQLKGRVNDLTNELNEIKTLLDKTEAAEAEQNEKPQIPSTPSSPTYPYTLPIASATEILPSKPQIVYASATQNQKQPSGYRVQVQPQNYETGKIIAAHPGHISSNIPNPLASHNRLSARTVRPRTDSFQSGKVTFDTQSVISNSSRKSKSLRLHSSTVSIPTTIQRSIENTYARPVIFRRADSARVYTDRPRRYSYHVTGNTKELKVFEYTGKDYGDVAL